MLNHTTGIMDDADRLPAILNDQQRLGKIRKQSRLLPAWRAHIQDGSAAL
jgi:hypothetical protein